MGAPRRWFITGVSSGLGQALAEAALARGDQVAATLRKADQAAAFAALAPGRAHAFQLDVTDEAAVRAAVGEAAGLMGGLDVAVNNAGYCLAGPIEAVSLAEARAQLETNLLAAITVIQAALPHLRAAAGEGGGGGRIINIGSLASVAGFPGMGLYSAAKFALAGLTESLAAEVAPFGVRATVVEPSGFRTRFAGSSLRFAERAMEPYAALDAGLRKGLAKSDGAQMNDPALGALALLALADHPDPPVHFALGFDARERIRGMLDTRLADYARTDPSGAETGFGG